MPHLIPRSSASDPGRVRMSRQRYLAVEQIESVGWRPKDRALVGVMERQLESGDSRAALVVSVNPWLVAAYTDELDCCVVLGFAPHTVQHLGWVPGQRLLTVNTYFFDDAIDLTPGPNLIPKKPGSPKPRYSNFRPAIAEALVDNPWVTERRKAAIGEAEWARCAEAAHEYLQYTGGRVRDGRPSRALMPPSPSDAPVLVG